MPDWMEFPLIVFFSILAAGLALILIVWLGDKVLERKKTEGK